MDFRLLTLSVLLLSGCDDPATTYPNGHAMGQGGSVEAESQTISLNPTAIAFSVIEGQSGQAIQPITVSSTSSGTVGWSASTTANWLLLSHLSGTTPDSFTIWPVVAGLAAGTYTATITVTGTGATNSPQSIPVDLTISPAMSSTPATTPPPSSLPPSIPTSPPPETPPITPSPPPPTVTVSLAWDPVPDPTVLGYYIHFGLQSPHSPGSCNYSQSTYYDLSSQPNKSLPTFIVSGLTPNTTYYFVVSAYNGLESPCSGEVSGMTPSA